LSLLILGPAPPPARLNNIKPVDLGTAFIAVRKGCYTALILS
jgi:hypothetical protein